MTDAGEPEPVDVLIVTATKLEYDAVLEVEVGAVPGSTWVPQSDPQDLRLAVRAFQVPAGPPLRFAVAQAAEMRAEATANRVARLVPVLSPRCLAMCGVCAGRSTTVNLGDVLAATLVWSFDHTAIVVAVDAGGNEVRHTRPETKTYSLPPRWVQALEGYQPPDELVARMQALRPHPLLPQIDWLLMRIAAGDTQPWAHGEFAEHCPDYKIAVQQAWKPDGAQWLVDGQLRLTEAGKKRTQRLAILDPHGLPPTARDPLRVRPVPMGSSNQLVRDESVWAELQNIRRDVAGLEMEAAAIGAEAQRNDISLWFVMKGVMDFAHREKDDRFKAFAARASAECLLDFLRTRLPARPSPERIAVPEVPAVPREVTDAAAERRLVIWAGRESKDARGHLDMVLDRVLAGARDRPGSAVSREGLFAAAADFRNWSRDEKVTFLRGALGAGGLDQEVVRLAASETAQDEYLQRLGRVRGALFLDPGPDDGFGAVLGESLGRRSQIVSAEGDPSPARLSAGDVVSVFRKGAQSSEIALAQAERQRSIDRCAEMLRDRFPKGPVLLLVGVAAGDPDLERLAKLGSAILATACFWLAEDGPRAQARVAVLSGLRPVWASGVQADLRWLDRLVEVSTHANEVRVLSTSLGAYRAEALHGFEAQHAEARKLTEAGRYDEALEKWRAMVDHAHQLAAQDPERAGIVLWALRCRLSVATCYINLQQVEEARSELARFTGEDVTALGRRQRASFAIMLTVLGEGVRAAGVLPEGEAAPDGDTEDIVREARDRVALANGGEPPREPPASAALADTTAWVWLARGAAATASRHAVVAAAERGTPGMQLSAAMVLLRALGGTIHEGRWVTEPVPPDERAASLSLIERILTDTRDAHLPAPVHRMALHSTLEFSVMTADDWLRDDAVRRIEKEGVSPFPSEGSDLGNVFELAATGRIDEALTAVPQLTPSWLSDDMRTVLLGRAMRADDALRLALDLAERWPGRAPIELRAAEMLLAAGRASDAVVHARLAVEGLSGRGQRLMLARCLLAANDPKEAWSVVQSLLDRDDPQALATGINAAAFAEPSRELPLIDRLLRLRPDDLLLKRHRMMALYRSGDVSATSAVAAELTRSHGHELDAGTLSACAELIRLAGPPDGERRELLLQVEQELRTRFPLDPDAEIYRLTLRIALGDDAVRVPINVELLRSAGKIHAFDVSQMGPIMAGQHALHTIYQIGWRGGDLSFEAWCKLSATASAYAIRRIVTLAEDGEGLLNGPAFLVEPAAPERLLGRRILVGELELLLLQQLRLFDELAAALQREGGRLVVFREVWAHILESAPTLAHDVQYERARRLDDLHDRLASPWIERPAGDPEVSDVEWARTHGLLMVGGGLAEGRRAAGALVDTLAMRGSVTPQVADALRAVVVTAGTVADVWAEVPRKALIDGVFLEILHEHGALRHLKGIFPDGIVIGPNGQSGLARNRRNLRTQREAAELATALVQSVGRGVSAGWVEADCRRPTAEWLWQSVEGHSDGDVLSRLREAFELSASCRLALEQMPEAVLVTADFGTGASFSERWRQLQQLRWNRSGALRLRDQLAAGDERVFDLMVLVDALVTGPRRFEMRRSLAEMGLATALDAAGIQKLAADFQGVHKEHPRRLLDRVEQIARRPEHLGFPAARMRLARTYATAIWEAFLERPAKPSAQALAEALLARVEELDRAYPMRSLDQVFGWLVQKTLSNPSESLTPVEADQFVLSPDTPSGRLWAVLAAFASASDLRRAVYGRGIRDVCHRLAESQRHPTEIGTAPLVQVLWQAKPFQYLLPEVSGLAILSAVWPTLPFVDMTTLIGPGNMAVTAGDLMASAVRQFEQGTVRSDGMFAQFEHAAGDMKVSFVLPIEAVLLRAGPPALAREAERIAELQAPHDGQMALLLRELALEPDNDSRRRALALRAAVAPWRLVREDPSVILAWRGAFQNTLSDPNGIEALRAMLLEEDPLPPKGLLLEFVVDRLRLGDGHPVTRSAGLLFEQATQVPGVLSTHAWMLWLFAGDDDAYGAQVDGILHELGDPDGLPIGRLCAHLFFLRVAARRRPNAKLPTGPADLNTELPALLVRVLDSVVRSHRTETEANPGSLTLADVEGAVLRVCGRVVQDLAALQVLPLRDGLWLTWRLYQWWCTQLAATDPGRHEEVFQTLRRHAPPVLPQVPPDRRTPLDPFAFDCPRYELRLAAVLFVLHNMEEVAAQFHTAAGGETLPPAKTSSPELEARLVALASREITPEERSLRRPVQVQQDFGWDGSAAVPDLALGALLSLNQTAFFELPTARRLVWLRDLPLGPDSKGRADHVLASRIVFAAALQAERLTIEERAVLEAYLHTVEGFDRVGEWRRFGLAALFEAGESHLEHEVAQLMEEGLGGNPDMAGLEFALYLLGLASQAPARWPHEARRFLELAANRGINPVPITRAIGQIVVNGPVGQQASARALLAELAGKVCFGCC